MPSQRDKWRRTPLHRAAKEGHKDIVTALLSSGAEINAQVRLEARKRWFKMPAAQNNVVHIYIYTCIYSYYIRYVLLVVVVLLSLQQNCQGSVR